MSSARTHNELDSFLNHGKRSGGFGNRLSWHEKGKLNFWFHTTQLPTSYWSHPFPMPFVKEDKDTRVVTKSFWSRDQVCYEDEAVIEARFFRFDDGSRKKPPCRCPMCKLLERVHLAIVKGDVSWLDTLFRFDGATKPEDNVSIRAGGFTGMFNSRKLTDEQKAELATAGISARNAYRESSMLKLKWAFTGVDADDIAAGVQTIDEPSSLGDAVKQVINDTIAAFAGDRQKGNPFLNPYPIQLTYNEKEQDIKKKYTARRIEYWPNPIPNGPAIPAVPTADVMDLIRGPAPSIEGMVSPFNRETLRSVMEKHANPDFDWEWDNIFGEPATSSQVPANAPVGAPVAVAAPGPGEEPCDTCHKPFPSTATTCPHCGTKYEVDPPTPADTTVVTSPAGSTGTGLPF